ncbi:MAG TPA: hypothetical protein VFA91_13460, partial [Candidatus Polarisedimenticolia bacterium]|nr:hypothetical protein [Candidatus Polarisedimenticolia bacterium]
EGQANRPLSTIFNLERTIAAIATAWLARRDIGATDPAFQRVFHIGDVGAALLGLLLGATGGPAGRLTGHAIGLAARAIERSDNAKAIPDGRDDPNQDDQLGKAGNAEHRAI